MFSWWQNVPTVAFADAVPARARVSPAIAAAARKRRGFLHSLYIWTPWSKCMSTTTLGTHQAPGNGAGLTPDSVRVLDLAGDALRLATTRAREESAPPGRTPGGYQTCAARRAPASPRGGKARF